MLHVLMGHTMHGINIISECFDLVKDTETEAAYYSLSETSCHWPNMVCIFNSQINLIVFAKFIDILIISVCSLSVTQNLSMLFDDSFEV